MTMYNYPFLSNSLTVLYPYSQVCLCHMCASRFLISFPVGVTHRHLSDHLSEVVENTLSDLEQSKVHGPINT